MTKIDSKVVARGGGLFEDVDQRGLGAMSSTSSEAWAHDTNRAVAARRIAGAVAGGLVAGLALSTVMLVGEKLSGKPSELIELERKTAAKLDLPVPAADTPATLVEQSVTHGGHLALSALAGVVYAVTVDEDADGAKSGAAFGLAFFIAAYGLTGPLLGVTPLPWREQPLRAVQHPVVHTLFGLAMAHFARKGSGR